MFLPKLFNHGTLRSIKTEDGKLVLEGTYGKEEFEGGSLPDIGEDDAGKVLMVDGGEAKWLWQLPPGTAGKVLTKTGTGAGDIAWRDVPKPSGIEPKICIQVESNQSLYNAGNYSGTSVSSCKISTSDDIRDYIYNDSTTGSNYVYRCVPCRLCWMIANDNYYVFDGLIDFSVYAGTVTFIFHGTGDGSNRSDANRKSNSLYLGARVSNVDMDSPVIWEETVASVFKYSASVVEYVAST